MHVVVVMVVVPALVVEVVPVGTRRSLPCLPVVRVEIGMRVRVREMVMVVTMMMVVVVVPPTSAVRLFGLGGSHWARGHRCPRSDNRTSRGQRVVDIDGIHAALEVGDLVLEVCGRERLGERGLLRGLALVTCDGRAERERVMCVHAIL